MSDNFIKLNCRINFIETNIKSLTKYNYFLEKDFLLNFINNSFLLLSGIEL